LFSDIVGLLKCRYLAPLAELLNEYWQQLRLFFDSGGTIGQVCRDAVMALFGAPEELTLTSRRHTPRACENAGKCCYLSGLASWFGTC